MPRVGIALGSNLGDRLANLQAARKCLREIATPGEPVLIATTYQTEPLLCPPGSPPVVPRPRTAELQTRPRLQSVASDASNRLTILTYSRQGCCGDRGARSQVRIRTTTISRFARSIP